MHLLEHNSIKKLGTQKLQCHFFYEMTYILQFRANVEKKENSEHFMILVLLGSYYKYWFYKCFNPYFKDQPVRIFVNT